MRIEGKHIARLVESLNRFIPIFCDSTIQRFTISVAAVAWRMAGGVAASLGRQDCFVLCTDMAALFFSAWNRKRPTMAFKRGLTAEGFQVAKNKSNPMHPSASLRERPRSFLSFSKLT